MPLNRPALPLGSGTRGVREARAWVDQICSDIGRAELSDCAALGVSELVTNALLHAGPPIEVQVRGTVEHPRVEVRDGSTRPPLLTGGPGGPSAAPEDERAELDDHLLTFGRGLDMVARAAVAWGAEIEEKGKVCWFEPAAELAEEAGVSGFLSGLVEGSQRPPPAEATNEEPMTVRLLGVPVGCHVDFQQHYRELRRELRLLALSHESDYPMARELAPLFAPLEESLRHDLGLTAIEEAMAADRQVVDLTVSLAPSRIGWLGVLADLLDMADVFCREQRLLVRERTPERARFARWLLGEFQDQRAGRPPAPWVEAGGTPVGHTDVS